MTYQLIEESFRESLRKERKYQDRRMQVLEEKGPITMKDLARIEMVSVGALTQWLEQRMEKGLVTWCDESGEKFPNEKSLERAKHTGKAFLKVTNSCRLPTPFELTEDDEWKPGGSLYQTYDLELGSPIPDSAIACDLDLKDSNEKGDEMKDPDQGVKDFRPDPGEIKEFSSPISDADYQQIVGSREKSTRFFVSFLKLH
jgi:hypothetical protein